MGLNLTTSNISANWSGGYPLLKNVNHRYYFLLDAYKNTKLVFEKVNLELITSIQSGHGII